MNRACALSPSSIGVSTRLSVLTALILVLIYAAPCHASDDGSITIVTVPERTEVWINNNYAGLSPITDRRLAPGSYTIRLTDPSQNASATETVVIRAGEHLRLERTLSARFGKLRVDTDPQGADVSIVTELGKTPLAFDYINPGAYKLEIRHPNTAYTPITEEIAFADGQPVSITHKLSKPKLMTNKKYAQLIITALAAAGWTWAVTEQSAAASQFEKARRLQYENLDEAKRLARKSRQAATRRTIAISAAGVLTAGLCVTIIMR